jgi:hypothetical protein
LKKEATCSSETQVYFQRKTRRYTPEDRNLENGERSVISYNFNFVDINIPNHSIENCMHTGTHKMSYFHQ